MIGEIRRYWRQTRDCGERSQYTRQKMNDRYDMHEVIQTIKECEIFRC